MLSYCVKCHRKTGNVGSRRVAAPGGRMREVSKCANCGTLKSQFISSSAKRGRGIHIPGGEAIAGAGMHMPGGEAVGAGIHLPGAGEPVAAGRIHRVGLRYPGHKRMAAKGLFSALKSLGDGDTWKKIGGMAAPVIGGLAGPVGSIVGGLAGSAIAGSGMRRRRKLRGKGFKEVFDKVKDFTSDRILPTAMNIASHVALKKAIGKVIG